MKPETEDLIFKIGNKDSFREFALDIFRIQSSGNKIYRDFIKNLRVDPEQVNPSPLKTPEMLMMVSFGRGSSAVRRRVGICKQRF